MRTLLAATGIAAAATIVGVGAYAAQSTSLDATSPTASSSIGVDDNGGLTDRDDRAEPGDDRDVQAAEPGATTLPSPSPSSSPESWQVDDNGGLTDRDDRSEPGDDRDHGSGSWDDDKDHDWDDKDDDWDDDHDDDWDDDWDDQDDD